MRFEVSRWLGDGQAHDRQQSIAAQKSESEQRIVKEKRQMRTVLTERRLFAI